MSGMEGQGVHSKLAELRQRFVAGVPARLERMQAHWQTRDLDALRREAHNLAGAAATYLCPELATAARQLEKASLALTDAMPADPELPPAAKALARLSALIASLDEETPSP